MLWRCKYCGKDIPTKTKQKHYEDHREEANINQDFNLICKFTDNRPDFVRV